jgi:hypothetical protein
MHWTRNDFFVHNAVLGSEPRNGDQTGQNLAIAFERILQQFGLWPRVTHVTANKGSAFLNMLRRLPPLLPGFTFGNNGLRCLAHLINNAIHCMFTAMHCEGFESEDVAVDRLHILSMGAGRQDLEDLPDDQQYEAQPRDTQVLDFERVLNKLRRLVCSVRLSDKRRRTLERHCLHTNRRYRVPTLDPVGRWNSTHDILDRLR